jgi:septum formation protein
MDKAGAYAIQGGASRWVERVEGPVDNVIGLPVDELQARLERLVDYLASRSRNPD